MKYRDRTTSYDVSRNTTVQELKHMIVEKESCKAEGLQLIWYGKILDDKATMTECNIKEMMCLLMMYGPPRKPKQPEM